MVRYEKCPRCDLNYIDPDKQEYCDVCIAEMKGEKLQFADLEDEIKDELLEELVAEEEICPICGVNPIVPGEKTCEACRDKTPFDEEEEEIDLEKDEEWKNYLEDDTDDLKIDETLKEELDAELAGDMDEEDEDEYDDFYESEDVDSLSDLESDDDFDDDDDDFDDDEDDDF